MISLLLFTGTCELMGLAQLHQRLVRFSFKKYGRPGDQNHRYSYIWPNVVLHSMSVPSPCRVSDVPLINIRIRTLSSIRRRHSATLPWKKYIRLKSNKSFGLSAIAVSLPPPLLDTSQTSTNTTVISSQSSQGRS